MSTSAPAVRQSASSSQTAAEVTGRATPDVQLVEAAVDDTQVVDHERVLGQYIPLLYHYNMLQDVDRVGAFARAIELTVQPGMHVVELGGGTGILSSLAARRGASVTLVERNMELVDCARRLVALNALTDSIQIIHADATCFVSDRPADVVICEMLHVGLLREKQTQVIAAFKRNHIKKHGHKLPVFLPEASILMAQPVQQDFTYAGYLAPVPVFQAPLVQQPRTTPLSDLIPYANVGYDSEIPNHFATWQEVKIKWSGTINAVQFVTQNVITIDEDQQKAVTWPNQCLVLPIETPLVVRSGGSIEMSFAYDAGGPVEQLARSLRIR